ncbi:MAG: hypothetical protein ACT4PT_05760 [Methanobacteriota archaeon]
MKVNVAFVLSVVLLVIGVGAYLIQGANHGTWTDPGVYSFLILLLGFGVCGVLYSQTEKPAA